MSVDLSRFITAQQRSYSTALSEIKRGRKTSHWIWYIFPQIEGLGRSSTAQYYSIHDMEEAKAFMADPYLSRNLIEISQALLTLDSNNATEVMGIPDDMKLRSSMTLFMAAVPEQPLFRQVRDKFYGGKPDRWTLQLLGLEG